MRLDVRVAWSNPPLRTVATAATVEVDVMPHLGRTPDGGPFNSYFESLQNLGAGQVRFAPWFGYPGVVVPELKQANCSGGGSSWNSTLLDEVVADFMVAVSSSTPMHQHALQRQHASGNPNSGRPLPSHPLPPIPVPTPA